jgi:hypothetical protein
LVDIPVPIENLFFGGLVVESILDGALLDRLAGLAIDADP